MSSEEIQPSSPSDNKNNNIDPLTNNSNLNPTSNPNSKENSPTKKKQKSCSIPLQNKNYHTEIIPISPSLTKKSEIFAKVEIIGDLGVGKTSLAKRITKDVFSPSYIATEGYEFYSYMIKVNNTLIQFQIWDMSGKENYRSALFNLYRNAAVGILVYSVNNRQSFENCQGWIKQMKEYGTHNNKIVLIGNKCDDKEGREVSKEEGEQICNKEELNLFMEVSAKEGVERPNFLELISIQLYEDFLVYKDDYDFSSDIQNKSVLLKSIDDIEGKNKKICC